MSRRRTPPRGPGIVLRSGFASGAGAAGWGGRLAGRLERIIDPDRLRKGRRVARSGYVLSLQVAAGEVRGAIQGSQPDPFETVCTVRELDRYDRAEIAAQVRAEPGVLTALASGQVPESLAERLLPADSADLDFDCTCPDAGWPCKHGAALLLLTAQEIGARPLQILTWRGLDVESLIEAVARNGPAECAAHGDDGAPGEGGPSGAAGRPGGGGGDPFAMQGPSPPLPDAGSGAAPAMDLLDTARLRAALRLWGPDTADAERELRRLYERFMDGS